MANGSFGRMASIFLLLPLSSALLLLLSRVLSVL